MEDGIMVRVLKEKGVMHKDKKRMPGEIFTTMPRRAMHLLENGQVEAVEAEKTIVPSQDIRVDGNIVKAGSSVKVPALRALKLTRNGKAKESDITEPKTKAVGSTSKKDYSKPTVTLGSTKKKGKQVNADSSDSE